MKKMILGSCLTFLSLSVFASSALTIPQSTTTTTGKKTAIRAMYQYTIENTTNVTQNYLGMEELEVNGVKSKVPVSFTLPPRSSKKSTDFRTLMYTPTSKGKYTIKSLIIFAGTGCSVAHSANATLTVN